MYYKEKQRVDKLLILWDPLIIKIKKLKDKTLEFLIKNIIKSIKTILMKMN